MGKLFELIDFLVSIIDWFLNLFTSLISLISTTFTLVVSVFGDFSIPPIIQLFMSIFFSLSLGMFIWRLIP